MRTSEISGTIKIMRFAPLAFSLRGFERIESQDENYDVVQGWRVEGA